MERMVLRDYFIKEKHMKMKKILVTCFLAAVVFVFVLQIREKFPSGEKTEVIETDNDSFASDIITEVKQSETIMIADDTSAANTQYKILVNEADMNYVDEQTFEALRDVYSQIDFHGDFKSGNTECYDYYKEKYFQLVNNKVPFKDKETGSDVYLNEYADIKRDLEIKKIRDDYTYNYTYLFFDIDEDGAPELCITDIKFFHYVFKYIPEEDQFYLWYRSDVGYYQIMGSRKVSWDRFEENNVFYILDKDGNEELILYFYKLLSSVSDEGQAHFNYIVALPWYQNDDKSLEDIKEQGYYREAQDVFYFQVTKEQYKELTKEYFEQVLSIQERQQAVSYTYDELFADFID